VLGVTVQQLPYAVDLFEGGGDGVRLVRADVHRPELRADAARPQPGDVGVQVGGLVAADVAGVEVVADLFAQRPRQVVVPVHDGELGQQRAGVVGGRHGAGPARLPKPKPAPEPSALARRRLPSSVAWSLSSCWNSRMRPRSSSSWAASMRIASRPALRAPATETGATGTPAGIRTIDSRDSIPSRARKS